MSGALVDLHPLPFDAHLPTSIYDFLPPSSLLLLPHDHSLQNGFPEVTAADVLQQDLITQCAGNTESMRLTTKPPSSFESAAVLNRGNRALEDKDITFMDAVRAKKDMGFRGKLPSLPDLRGKPATYDDFMCRNTCRMGVTEQERHNECVGFIDDDVRHVCNLQSFAIALQSSLGNVQASALPSHGTLHALSGALQKFLPSNNENGTSDYLLSDEFRMYVFKVRKCMHSKSHDWTECPFAHPGEKARRRDPRGFHYSSTSCPDYRKGNCKRGDSCELAHGIFECWLHPDRYRTQLCKDGKACTRRVCFFAHSHSQLRVMSPHTAASFAYSGSASNMAKPVFNGNVPSRLDVSALAYQWGQKHVPEQISANSRFGDGCFDGLSPKNIRNDCLPDELTPNVRHTIAHNHGNPFANLSNEFFPACKASTHHEGAVSATFDSYDPTSLEGYGFLDEEFCLNQQDSPSRIPSQRLSARPFFDNVIKMRGTSNNSDGMSKLRLPRKLGQVSSPTSILMGQTTLSPLSSPCISPSLSSPSLKSFSLNTSLATQTASFGGHADFFSPSIYRSAEPQPSMAEMTEVDALFLSRLRHRIDINGSLPFSSNTTGKHRPDRVNPMPEYEASHVKRQSPSGEADQISLSSAAMQNELRHAVMKMVMPFPCSQSVPTSPESEGAGLSLGELVTEPDRRESENPDIGWITELIK